MEELKPEVIHWSDLIKDVSARCEVSQDQARHICNMLIFTIKDNLFEQKEVVVQGLGVIRLIKHKEQMFVLPDGGKIWTPARYKPRLKFGAGFLKQFKKIKPLEQERITYVTDPEKNKVGSENNDRSND